MVGLTASLSLVRDSARSWSLLPPFPGPSIYQGAMTAWAGDLFLLGGINTSTSADFHSVYRSTNDASSLGTGDSGCRVEPSLRSPGCDLGHSRCVSQLILTGGYSGSAGYLNDVWYTTNPSTGSAWRQYPAPGWTARYCHQLASFSQQTQLILFGGNCEAGVFCNDVWSG